MKIKKRFWFLSDSVVGEMWQKIWEEEETIEKNSKNQIWKHRQRDVMIYERKNEREFNMTFTNSKRQNKMIKMTGGRFRSDLDFFDVGWCLDENRN